MIFKKKLNNHFHNEIQFLFDIQNVRGELIYHLVENVFTSTRVLGANLNCPFEVHLPYPSCAFFEVHGL